MIRLVGLLAALSSTIGAVQDQGSGDRARTEQLQLSAYATSHQVEQLATDAATRTRTGAVIRKLGISKVYVEVYRSGHVVRNDQLVFVRDWLRDKGLAVVGGIATVPGNDFGVRQEGPLQWFNWQAEKTQTDLRKVIRSTAGIFDTFIVDDFLCTGDVSARSKAAKGDRSWGQYRRELMTELAQSVFIQPAREVNPAITMIIKYPQWYDRFHLFGYDTEKLPHIFDRVWVGTETRGRATQRFGFVQPYEGFVNYRWMADIAGDKIGGAWFDHGDCSEHDFIDQAYMSVLAGARELVFFNLGDLWRGHPDHPKVAAQFSQLANLSAVVRTRPATGIPAYKPPNSDPAGDMYLMDFLGMMGIPIVPVSRFPMDAPVVLLPAQAASDPRLIDHVLAVRAKGTRLVVTASLLHAVPELARLAGLDQKVLSCPFSAPLASDTTSALGQASANVTVELESPLTMKAGPGDISCLRDNQRYAFLFASKMAETGVAVLNTHTFSQADFDAVGEVLLSPRPLGLLKIEGKPLETLRRVFHDPSMPRLDAPNGITIHTLDGQDSRSLVIQNFNERTAAIEVTIRRDDIPTMQLREVWEQKTVVGQADDTGTNVTFSLSISPRGRVWLQPLD